MGVPKVEAASDAAGVSKGTHLLVVQQELLEVVEGDLAQLGAVHVPGAWKGRQQGPGGRVGVDPMGESGPPTSACSSAP